MEKFNSSNYREARQKSILLLWAESPNAKLIMSSKAPALCNVSVRVTCVQVRVYSHSQVCTLGVSVQYKRSESERDVCSGEVKVFYSVFV